MHSLLVGLYFDVALYHNFFSSLFLILDGADTYCIIQRLPNYLLSIFPVLGWHRTRNCVGLVVLVICCITCESDGLVW